MDRDNSINLKAVRKELRLSQAELADLIGVSQRTVQSCEQGWRKLSPALEKAVILLLLASRRGVDFGISVCWESVDSFEKTCKDCLVYQSRQGHLCWLLSGNVCQGKRLRTWQDKKGICMQCHFFQELLSEGIPITNKPMLDRPE